MKTNRSFSQEINAALAIRPDNVWARYMRGQLYFNQEDYLNAFADLTYVLNAEDTSAQQFARDLLLQLYPEGISMEEAIALGVEHYSAAVNYDNNGQR